MGKADWRINPQGNHRSRKSEGRPHWILRVTLKHPKGDVSVSMPFRAVDKEMAKMKACRLLKQFLAKWLEENFYARLQARLAKEEYDKPKSSGSSPVFILKHSSTYVDGVAKAKGADSVFKEIKEKKGRKIFHQALNPRRIEGRSLPVSS